MRTCSKKTQQENATKKTQQKTQQESTSKKFPKKTTLFPKKKNIISKKEYYYNFQKTIGGANQTSCSSVDTEEALDRRIQQRAQKAKKQEAVKSQGRRCFYLWIIAGVLCLLMGIGVVVWVVCKNKEKEENDRGTRGMKPGMRGRGNLTKALNLILSRG
jgi:hypothetical protein